MSSSNWSEALVYDINRKGIWEEFDKLHHAHNKISEVTPVSKNVYREDFTSETISCVISDMVSENPVISWRINDEYVSSEHVTLTGSPQAYTSILTLTERLDAYDKVYTCTVKATTKSEIAVVEVFLNFYCKSLLYCYTA